MRNRGALVALVCVLLAPSFFVPAAAHHKSWKATVRIDEVEAGSPGFVIGAVRSGKEACAADREVRVFDGKTLIGTVLTDESGSFELEAPVTGGAQLVAKAAKTFVKKSKKHKHSCAAATSRGFAVPAQLVVRVVGDGTVISDPQGIDCDAVTSPCSAAFSSATPTALEATPDTGASFTGWSGDCSGTANPCTLRVDGNKEVTATFTFAPPPVTRTLEIEVTGPGRVTGSGINCTSDGGDCSEDYPIDQQVTVTASEDGALASFDGWGDACSGTASTCMLTMDIDRRATAAFSCLLPEPLCGIAGSILSLFP